MTRTIFAVVAASHYCSLPPPSLPHLSHSSSPPSPQIDDRRKLLFPVQPKPPQGFKDYLMNRGTYVLAGNPSSHHAVPLMVPPSTLQQAPLRDLFTEQERDRHKLRLQVERMASFVIFNSFYGVIVLI